MRFFRSAEHIDEPVVRGAYEEARKMGAVRVIIVTSSGFSTKARLYSENRPIDLFDKERLLELLSRAEM